MSKRESTKIKCPGCGFTTLVLFKVPGFMRPSHENFKCSECNSKITCRFEQIRNGGKRDINRVMTYPYITQASQMLQDMKREESEHNAKEPEYGTYVEET